MKSPCEGTWLPMETAPYNGLSVLPRCHSRGEGSVRGPCTCTSSQVTAAPESCPPCTLRPSWAGATWCWVTKPQSNRRSDFEGHFKTSWNWMLHPPAFFHTCTDFPKFPSWQLKIFRIISYFFFRFVTYNWLGITISRWQRSIWEILKLELGKFC